MISVITNEISWPVASSVGITTTIAAWLGVISGLIGVIVGLASMIIVLINLKRKYTEYRVWQAKLRKTHPEFVDDIKDE